MSLFTNGILQLGELAEELEESFAVECTLISNIYLVLLIHYGRERWEHHVFGVLLQMVPGLETQLMNGDKDQVVHTTDKVNMILMSTVYLFTYLVLLASESTQSDDMKSLKGAVLDWIVPTGQLLTPLAHNVKMDRGFHHEHTGLVLCPAGMDWLDQESITSVGSRV